MWNPRSSDARAGGHLAVGDADLGGRRQQRLLLAVERQQRAVERFRRRRPRLPVRTQEGTPAARVAQANPHLRPTVLARPDEGNLLAAGAGPAIPEGGHDGRQTTPHQCPPPGHIGIARLVSPTGLEVAAHRAVRLHDRLLGQPAVTKEGVVHQRRQQGAQPANVHLAVGREGARGQQVVVRREHLLEVARGERRRRRIAGQHLQPAHAPGEVGHNPAGAEEQQATLLVRGASQDSQGSLGAGTHRLQTPAGHHVAWPAHGGAAIRTAEVGGAIPHRR